MKHNQGTLDWALRIVIGVALLALFFLGPKPLLALVGIVLMVTAVAGFCPVYRAIGVSTHPSRR